MGEIVKILAVQPRTAYIERLLENDSLLFLMNKMKDEIDFDVQNQEENPLGYQSLSDIIVQLDSQVFFLGKEFKVSIKRKTYDDQNFFLNVEIITEWESTAFGDEFYQLKIRIKKEVFKYFKKIYWQKDTQNQKVCTELYADIHKVENVFRELIIDFMTLKYGRNWFRSKITKPFLDKMNLFSSWYSSNYIEFRDIDTGLFNLQINDLIDMLKKSSDEFSLTKEEVVELFRSYNLVEEAKREIMQQIENHSVWTVHFVGLLGEGFEGKWENLKNMRNMVAHNKPICNPLYQDTKSVTAEIDNMLINAAENMNNSFSSREDDEIENLRADMESEQNDMSMEDLYFELAGLDPTPSEEDVLEEIDLNEDVRILLSTAEECKNTLESKIEELLEFFQDKLNDIAGESDYITCKDRVLMFIEHFSNLFNFDVISSNLSEANDLEEAQEVLSDVVEEVESLREKYLLNVRRSIVQEKFVIDTLCHLLNPSGNSLEVIATGELYAEAGNIDEIVIEVYMNGDKQKHIAGTIEKTYGDYEIHDDNLYPIATQDDELWVEVSDVIKAIDNFESEGVEFLNTILSRIETYEEQLENYE